MGIPNFQILAPPLETVCTAKQGKQTIIIIIYKHQPCINPVSTSDARSFVTVIKHDAMGETLEIPEPSSLKAVRQCMHRYE